MGDWGDGGEAGAVTLSQAAALADEWVAANQAGATVGSGFQMPMGYVFPVSRNGITIGMLVVNDDSGALMWRPYAPPNNQPNSKQPSSTRPSVAPTSGT
jgi:hypothetical protein